MTKRSLSTIIALLFIVSGATGLVYQIVWFKYLSLFLGNTTQAQSVVLATFMGGLAIGATVWGRKADRSSHPLILYALLEIGIALYCLVYPFLLNSVKEAFIAFTVRQALPSDGPAVLMLKIGVSLATLLLPTILMGGTLPVLVKVLAERIEDSGRTVARLYYVNSFGAVLGSIVAGFFLVRSIGLQSTITLAALTNLAIGIAAFAIGRAIRPAAARPAEGEAPSAVFPLAEGRVALIVAGVSGLAAMIYEVAWVRLLIPVLGSSTYSFTLMLVAFISGITIGSWLIARWMERVKNVFGLLAFCQVGVGLSLLLGLPLYGRIPYYFWHVAHLLARSDSTYPIFLSLQFLFGFVIMLLPTVFLGMSLPVATRIASRSLDRLGKSVGTVFGINTLGTVIGALGGGLLLIPLIGVQRAFGVGIVLNLLAGIAVILAGGGRARGSKLVFAGVLAGVTILSLMSASSWSRLIMLSGVFRQINRNVAPPSSFAEFSNTREIGRVLFYREGSSATVGVIESQYGGALQKVLLVNGKADASSRGDLPTQVLLAQLPLLLHPHPDTALVIGLGSGVTAGSALTHPLGSVDCVEISPEVVDASGYFDDVNRHPLADPRMRFHVDDALSYLKLSDRRYDVIISEPTNPWIAGIGNLFTREFFTECASRMNPGGIMVQWFHLYEMDDETFRLVLQTFRSGFRYITVWQSWTMDVMLLGSNDPLTLDLPALRRKMSDPAVAADLRRINITEPVQLLSLQMASDDQVQEYMGYSELNTEDLPLLEYGAPRAFFVNRGVTEFQKFDERLAAGRGRLLLEQYRDRYGVSDDEKRLVAVMHAAADGGNLNLAYSLLRDYAVRRPADDGVMADLADAAVRLGRREEGLGLFGRLAAERPDDPRIVERYAWLKYSTERLSGSVVSPPDVRASQLLLQHCADISSDSVDRYHVEIGDIALAAHADSQALAHYRRALEIREKYAPSPEIPQDALLVKYATALVRTGDRTSALAYAAQAARVNPANAEARDLAYTLYMHQLSAISP